MKTCTKCRSEKSLAEFTKNSRKKDGLHTQCKTCVAVKSRRDYEKRKVVINLATKKYYSENMERTLAKQREYGNAHVEERKTRCKEWYENNKERATAASKVRIVTDKARHARYVKAWYERNKGRKVASVVSRRVASKLAAPVWADKKEIESIYAFSNEFRKAGISVDVDHIVPIRSSLVCGLHVPANLRVVLTSHNQAKGNRTWPDMP